MSIEQMLKKQLIDLIIEYNEVNRSSDEYTDEILWDIQRDIRLTKRQLVDHLKGIAY